MSALRFAVMAFALAGSASAHAASAIVHDGKGNYGYQMNDFTQSAAVASAVRSCARRSGTCTRVDSTDEEGFSAIFMGQSGIGYALAEKTPEQAQRKAQAMCEKQATQCRLELVWREKPLQVLPPTSHPTTCSPAAEAAPSAQPVAGTDGTISAIKAVELANERAPQGVEGRFRFEVKATDTKGPLTFLSSEQDYRDQRNLGIIIEQDAARGLEARLGAPPADALRGRRIEVAGRAERRRIDFFSNGIPSGRYYYQTNLRVTDAAQITVIE